MTRRLQLDDLIGRRVQLPGAGVVTVLDGRYHRRQHGDAAASWAEMGEPGWYLRCHVPGYDRPRVILVGLTLPVPLPE